MFPITAAQTKAGRALLDWSQDDLAAASDLSATTIRGVESGNRSPRSLQAIKKAMENAGLEFIGEQGVKLRDDQMKILRGHQAPTQFFGMVQDALRQQGGDILFAARNLDCLAHAFGYPRFADHRLIQNLSALAPIQCILSETPDDLTRGMLWPEIACRLTNEVHIGRSAYIIYGDRAADIWKEGNGQISFILIDLPTAVIESRRHFRNMWCGAAILSGAQTKSRLPVQQKRMARIADHVVLPPAENAVQSAV